MNKVRIIRFEGHIIREDDAITYLVEEFRHTREYAEKIVARAPTREGEKPEELRHFKMNRKREAAEWDAVAAREQDRAERRDGGEHIGW